MYRPWLSEVRQRWSPLHLDLAQDLVLVDGSYVSVLVKAGEILDTANKHVLHARVNKRLEEELEDFMSHSIDYAWEHCNVLFFVRG